MKQHSSLTDLIESSDAVEVSIQRSYHEKKTISQFLTNQNKKNTSLLQQIRQREDEDTLDLSKLDMSQFTKGLLKACIERTDCCDQSLF